MTAFQISLLAMNAGAILGFFLWAKTAVHRRADAYEQQCEKDKKRLMQMVEGLEYMMNRNKKIMSLGDKKHNPSTDGAEKRRMN